MIVAPVCRATWPAKTTCNAWGEAWGTHGCRLDPGHDGPHVCACNRSRYPQQPIGVGGHDISVATGS